MGSCEFFKYSDIHPKFRIIPASNEEKSFWFNPYYKIRLFDDRLSQTANTYCRQTGAFLNTLSKEIFQKTGLNLADDYVAILETMITPKFKITLRKLAEHLEGDYFEDKDAAESRLKFYNSFLTSGSKIKVVKFFLKELVNIDNSDKIANDVISELLQFIKDQFLRYEGRTERDAEYNSAEATKIIDRIAYYRNDMSEEGLEEDDNEDEEGVTWT